MTKEGLQKPVFPAKAGNQAFKTPYKSVLNWMPAFAGMTAAGFLQSFPNVNRINLWLCRAACDLFLDWMRPGPAALLAGSQGPQLRRGFYNAH